MNILSILCGVTAIVLLLVVGFLTRPTNPCTEKAGKQVTALVFSSITLILLGVLLQAIINWDKVIIKVTESLN